MNLLDCQKEVKDEDDVNESSDRGIWLDEKRNNVHT